MVESLVICGEVPMKRPCCQQMVQGCTRERQLRRTACSRLEIESFVLLRSGGGPPRLERFFRLLSCDSS
ncbi:Poly [ADP-ribose] polymerase [Fusarium oxysporum f. sp. albedinis]|nr:Poly [ADP-ribose] polymerase [Fusarium oxysporum f. sp. albedinis]